MKEKIIDYIELLEAKARQNDEYYKERLELYVSNQEKDKKLEAYENMRKEVIKFIRDKTRLIKIIDKIDEFELDLYLKENEINELLNILNKVGGSDE